MFGYYRQAGVDPSDPEPCSPCDCDNVGSTGEDCVKVNLLGTFRLHYIFKISLRGS